MVAVNSIILGGHLGADPEEKRTTSGKSLCTFNVAVNRWEAKSEDTVVDWHTVVAFERQAEMCLRYLRKGAPVLVEGRVVVRQWEGNDGKKHSRYEVVAGRVSFLGSRGASEARVEERPVGVPAALPPAHPPSFAEQVPF